MASNYYNHYTGEPLSIGDFITLEDSTTREIMSNLEGSTFPRVVEDLCRKEAASRRIIVEAAYWAALGGST
jgi:hypothetical protein